MSTDDTLPPSEPVEEAPAPLAPVFSLEIIRGQKQEEAAIGLEIKIPRDEDMTILEKYNEHIIQKQVELGSLVLLSRSVHDGFLDRRRQAELGALEEQKTDLLMQLQGLRRELLEKVYTIARSMGMDPEHGRWNLDFVGRRFTRPKGTGAP